MSGRLTALSGGRVFLPFECDGMLAAAAGKTFLLAEDRKLEETTMLRQIGR